MLLIGVYIIYICIYIYYIILITDCEISFPFDLDSKKEKRKRKKRMLQSHNCAILLVIISGVIKKKILHINNYTRIHC